MQYCGVASCWGCLLQHEWARLQRLRTDRPHPFQRHNSNFWDPAVLKSCSTSLLCAGSCEASALVKHILDGLIASLMAVVRGTQGIPLLGAPREMSAFAQQTADQGAKMTLHDVCMNSSPGHLCPSSKGLIAHQIHATCAQSTPQGTVAQSMHDCSLLLHMLGCFQGSEALVMMPAGADFPSVSHGALQCDFICPQCAVATAGPMLGARI